ncbi:unnamed protein product [Effrenium voratum]|uniref:RRM domain-containing protein n=1 Tax=Effrenium voratum TaxID=2562239 RepID=A0AA36J4Y2_9DINO|nr:unnamed protein product [Effrenium voratum]CAJ1421168.1 unnamed protein product [Effrenium voratum]
MAEPEEGELVRFRVHRTFVESVVLVPWIVRARSWPEMRGLLVELPEEPHDQGVTVANLEEKASNLLVKKNSSIQETEEEFSGEDTEADCLGVHPDDPCWDSTTNLMICKLPARCTQAELTAFIRKTVPGFELQISLPRSESGRNRGYGFVQVRHGSMRELVRRLWNSRIPTRQSQRPLKLQPARR